MKAAWILEKLVETRIHSGGAVVAARKQGQAKQLEKPSSSRTRNRGSKVGSITAKTGNEPKGLVLVDGHLQWDGLFQKVYKRLLEELTKLQVEVNTEKTRLVDLTKDESFEFLGFEFRRIRGKNGKWQPRKTPKTKKRTELLHSVKEVFDKNRSQPVESIIAKINPILRGTVCEKR